MQKILTRKTMLPLLAILGAAAAMLIVKTQPELAHSDAEKKTFLAETISTQPGRIKPEIVGFGTVEPDIQLPVKAEVGSKITYLHPNLKKGALLPAGTLLVKLDNKDFQLALKQATADVLVNQQNYQQLLLTIENTKLDLQLAEQKRSVVENEFQRKLGLHKQGSVSQSELDAQQQALLQIQQEVQNLTGYLTTLPAELEVLKARIEIAEATVEQAQRNIERTEVSLPFTSRISAVYVEENQFIGSGSALFEASSFDKMLINAQFSVKDFRRIVATLDTQKVNIQQLLTSGASSPQKLLSGLSVIIEHPTEQNLKWPAKVERIADNLDPQTRTVGVIVSVLNNYAKFDPRTKPPLVKGMYLSVRLQGKASDYVLIPRSAIKADTLYLVDNQDHLRKQQLLPLFTQRDIALYNPDDITHQKVVVSELFPAVEGMALLTQTAVDLEQQLREMGEQTL
ncbi:efflux RND transporter periplasmic adaptor subunit [Planctobacterium marinum]|uniref:Uncharacterized protein n=1 Tax=Planctobacterium marinum TaxID=1631968 RepID=A0AA48HD81_9ALTE|nr:hypothetical protein MACH26_03740 [Planctobacterium marinum]